MDGENGTAADPQAPQGQEQQTPPQGQEQQTPPQGDQGQEQQTPPQGDQGQEQPPKGDDKTSTLLTDVEGEEGSEGGVPEKYEFAPPDGFDLSEEVQARLDEFSGTAREMGLTQAQYQSLIEYDIQRGAAAVEEAATAYVERVDGWRKQTSEDKELGGEALAENVALARTAMQAFGSEGLTKLLSRPTPENPDGLGLGEHPEVVRFMHRVGRALADADLVIGGDTPDADENSLQKLYPTMFENTG